MKSISAATRSAGGSTELGFRVLGVAAVVCFVGLYFAADFIRGQPEVKKDKEEEAAPADVAADAGMPTDANDATPAEDAPAPDCSRDSTITWRA